MHTVGNGNTQIFVILKKNASTLEELQQSHPFKKSQSPDLKKTSKSFGCQTTRHNKTTQHKNSNIQNIQILETQDSKISNNYNSTIIKTYFVPVGWGPLWPISPPAHSSIPEPHHVFVIS